MTIVVKRQRHESKFQKEMRDIGNRARRISATKLESADRASRKMEGAENRLRGAAVRRYAKKHNLELHHRRSSWILKLPNGWKIAMPAGYFAWVGGVLENFVAV